MYTKGCYMQRMQSTGRRHVGETWWRMWTTAVPPAGWFTSMRNCPRPRGRGGCLGALKRGVAISGRGQVDLKMVRYPLNQVGYKSLRPTPPSMELCWN